MKNLFEISNSKIAKIAGLALVLALSVSFINLSHAGSLNLTVNVSNFCGDVELTIVNGPNDGAQATTSSGSFTFTGLDAGIFHVHAADSQGHSADSGDLLLESDQSIGIDLGGGNCENPTPTPTPTDLCTNLDGIQTTIPSGYEDPDRDGICTQIPPPTPTPTPTPTPPQGSLVCNPANQTVSVNSAANFSVVALNVPQERVYSWTAPSSTNPAQSGQNLSNFSTSYQIPGDYTVQVFSPWFPGYDYAFCHVTITDNETGSIAVSKVVRNVSNGEDGFSSSVSADPADVVEFRINVSASTASVNNVVLSDSLPSRLTYVNNSLTVNGDANGNSLSNLSLGIINAGQTKTVLFRATVDSSSEFGSGTTTLTNVATVTSASNTATASANVVVTKDVENPNLTIVKSIRNLTENDSSFVDEVSASAGDRVEFKVTVTAHNSTAHNVEVNDDLPSKLELDSGSTDHSFGDVFVGDSESYTFIAKVVPASSLSCGSNTITNTAQATSSNAGSDSDSAVVIASRSCGGGGGGGGSSGTRLTITKTVRNISTNSGFGSSITANNGQTVEFRLVVRNTGSRTARDVEVTDSLPFGLNYVNGTFHVNSSTSRGSLFGNGQEIGDISRDQERVLTFQATVNSTLGQTLINTASADAANTSKVSDTASVTVSGVVAGATIFVAPKTGPASTTAAALGFAFITTLGIIAYRKRSLILPHV